MLVKALMSIFSDSILCVQFSYDACFLLRFFYILYFVVHYFGATLLLLNVL